MTEKKEFGNGFSGDFFEGCNVDGLRKLLAEVLSHRGPNMGMPFLDTLNCDSLNATGLHSFASLMSDNSEESSPSEESLPSHLREALSQFRELWKEDKIITSDELPPVISSNLRQILSMEEGGLVAKIQGSVPKIIEGVKDPEICQAITDIVKAQEKNQEIKARLDEFMYRKIDLLGELSTLGLEINTLLTENFPELDAQNDCLDLVYNEPSEEKKEGEKNFHIRVNGIPHYELKITEELNKLGLRREEGRLQLHEMTKNFESLKKELVSEKINYLLFTIEQRLENLGLINKDDIFIGIIPSESNAVCFLAMIDEPIEEIPTRLKQSLAVSHITGKRKLSEEFLDRLDIGIQVKKIEEILKNL